MSEKQLNIQGDGRAASFNGREKAYLEQLFEDAPEAIVQIINNKIININTEFTALFGYTREDAIGNDIDKLLVSPKYGPEAREILEKINSGEKVFMESERIHKNGKHIHVSLLGMPVILEGEVIGIFGIYRDITDRKKAEKVQQLIINISTAVLTSSNLEDLLDIIRKELNTILDTTNLFIAFYNKENRSLSFPFFVDEKDRFENYPAEGTITGYIVKTEKPMLLRPGDLEELEKQGEIDLVGSPSKVWLGVPLHKKGDIFGVISLQSYDDEDAFTEEDLDLLVFISNQISLAIIKIQGEQSLQEAKQKAEEGAIAKQQFLSTMSHEIRTPLNAVIGMSQLLLTIEPRPDQLEYLSALKYSGESLLSLVNDILDFNKLDSSKLVLEELEIDPASILENIMKMFKVKATEKKNIIIMDPITDIPASVLGDKIRLNQVLTNLVSNAIKFTSEGEIRLGIKLKEETDKNYLLEFYIKDTGIGISEENKEMIFESFTQERSDITRLFGGSGLGLAICKKLVEVQGGTISVDSSPGKGSNFTFEIPYNKVNSRPLSLEDTRKSTIRQTAEGDNEKPTEGALGGKKVLVVEDNRINRVVARKFLENWGIEVFEAENGAIALDMLEENTYDLILMDLQMPVMDGYAATRKIKSLNNGKYKKLPIVALTASVLLEVKDDIRRAGLDDVLMKPFEAPELFKMLSKYMNGHS